MNDDTKKLFVFDDLSGDKEFRENIRRFFSKEVDRIIVKQYILHNSLVKFNRKV